MSKSYILQDIKPDNSDNLIRIRFDPDAKARFTVLSVTPQGYEYFEGSFFCLADANGEVARMIGIPNLIEELEQQIELMKSMLND